MAKTLLRSGNLDDYQAVGGGGQAVFDSALQIREALRLRRQQPLVDCLAIPQINDGGDRVDWYSPLEGDVVSWKAADKEARLRALRYLENSLASVGSLSKKACQSPKTAQQLFGSLLAKAFQFPGENFLYLVDGKPVITFWGFVNLNESARDDILDCLRESLLPEPPPRVETEPEPPAPVITVEPVDALPEPSPALRARVEERYRPEPEPDLQPAITAPAPEPLKKRRLPRRALPVAAAMIIAIAAPLLWPKATPVAAVEPAALPRVGKPLPELTRTLPLRHAEVVPVEVAPSAPAPEAAAVAPVAKDLLVMAASQVKAGSTRFLNGSWRVMLDVKDPITGKPPSLRYQIQNNKGTARVVHGDNIICRTEIFSGLHSNGELLIKTRGNARCTDGSRYPMPEIACKAGTNDVAECTARYDAHTVVPLTFKKAGV
ncbi:SrfA family protein [Pseudenterobacter timonensis]|uniref:SrfA family protein n=1 Tax=Pseudenterobacter timonensis TaxID=1755099 RepID=A0AAE4DME1_9ENTR|nr:SrfA family protein [Pseudenterobacter timonensis]MDR9890323.1 SrfA family protein [Pseudenterobacter timonensis]